MKLTIGIINWNTKKLLDSLLQSVYKNIECEIIVVDNNSSDGSVELVQTRFPKVNLIVNKSNLGFTKACNQIIGKMKGEYLLLLNTDIILKPHDINLLVEFMEKHPDAAVCGPKLVDSKGNLEYSAKHFHTLSTVIIELLGLHRIFPNSRFFGRYYMSYWDHSSVKEVDFISGAAFLMRKSAIKDIGYFNEKYHLYVQEAEWCFRAAKKGWKVYYYPLVQFIHLGGASTKCIKSQASLQHKKERLLFFKENYGIRVAKMLYLITLIFLWSRTLSYEILNFLNIRFTRMKKWENLRYSLSYYILEGRKILKGKDT
jgi:hypothetical protein